MLPAASRPVDRWAWPNGAGLPSTPALTIILDRKTAEMSQVSPVPCMSSACFARLLLLSVMMDAAAWSHYYAELMG